LIRKSILNESSAIEDCEHSLLWTTQPICSAARRTLTPERNALGLKVLEACECRRRAAAAAAAAVVVVMVVVVALKLV
jgi:hypothetical protein